MRYIEFSAIILIFIGVNVYVFYRLFLMLPVILPLQILLIVSAVVVQLPFFISIFFGSRLPVNLVSLLYKIGTSWLIVFVYLFLIFIVCDIVRLLHLINIDRFMFHSWLGWCVLIGFISVLLFIGNKNYYSKKRVELDLKIEKTIKSPLKIVLISDLHLGYGIGKDELEQWINLINTEKPDAVLIAGDVVDNYLPLLNNEKIYKSLRKIKSRYGTFMSLGNHEYFGNIDKRLDFFEKSSIRVLRDSAILVDSNFYIVGRDDASRKYRNSLENLTANLDHSKCIIVLDHQPSGFEEAQNCGVDLLLSGHTHHGQVFPLNLIAKAFFGKPYGYYKNNNTNFYVTSGIGLWGGKFRLGTRSEYVVITIK